MIYKQFVILHESGNLLDFVVCQSSILTGLNRQPRLDQLNDHVRPIVSIKWYDLGVVLLNDYNMLDIIKNDHPNDTETCCTAMFKVWLQRDDNSSWSKLVSALRAQSVALNVLAGEVERMFETGEAVNLLCSFIVIVYELQIHHMKEVKAKGTAGMMRIAVAKVRLVLSVCLTTSGQVFF